MEVTRNKKRSHIAERSGRRGASALLCLVCALLLVFQSVFSASARSGGDSIWVEICGEFGVEVVQLDMSGEEPVEQRPCLDCDDCLFCAVMSGDVAATPSAPALPSAPAAQAVRPTFNCHAVNPAQFWPDNRGPPLRDTIEKTAIRSPMDQIRSAGVTPWT